MNNLMPFIMLVVLITIGVINFFAGDSLWLEIGLIGFLIVFYNFFVRKEVMKEFKQLSKNFKKIELRFERIEKLLELEETRLKKDVKLLKKMKS